MSDTSFVFLLAAGFFGVMAVVNFVKVHRKKEKVYYLGATVGFLMCLAGISIFRGQLLVGMVLFVSTGVVSVAGLPAMMRVREREAKRLVSETDLSAPLSWREFLTEKGWLKLASRWGMWKTVIFYSLFTTTITGVVLFVLSLYGIMSVTYVVGYTITSAILSAYMFHRQIRSASIAS